MYYHLINHLILPNGWGCMEIRQLAYAAEAIREGTYKKAAEKLFVSPQTISKAVLALEVELGIVLVNHKRGHVKPTPFGLLFAERAWELVSDFVDLREMAQMYTREYSQAKSMSFAATCSPLLGMKLDTNLFSFFKESYQSLQLDLIHQHNENCRSALVERHVDASLFLGHMNSPGIQCRRITSLDMHVAFSLNHPLASKDILRLSDLQDIKLVQPYDICIKKRIICRHFGRHGYKHSFVDVDPSIEARLAALHRHACGMFVLKTTGFSKLYPRVVLKPLAGTERLRIPLCYAYQENSESLLPVEHLYLYLLKIAGEHDLFL